MSEKVTLTEHLVSEDGKSIVPNIKEDEKPLPLINSGASMSPDMKFGWKPKQEVSGAPIPLYFHYEKFDSQLYDLNPLDFIYLGFRPKNSIEAHKVFSNKMNI